VLLGTYRNDADNAVEDNSTPMSNLNVLVAINKGTWEVKLFSSKILRFLLKVLANVGCPV